MRFLFFLLAFFILLIVTAIFLALNLSVFNSDTIYKTNSVVIVSTPTLQTANANANEESKITVQESDVNQDIDSNSNEDVNLDVADSNDNNSSISSSGESGSNNSSSNATNNSSSSNNTSDNNLSNDINDSTTNVSEPLTLKEKIKSFIYQLQDVNFEELLSQNADIVFLSEKTPEEQIKQLQDSNTIVISYLSIGEAETWRDYWLEGMDSNWPFWVAENQEQDSSLVVKYWENEWQELTFSRLDKILEKGFDGVVLDTVSTGYHYWEKQGLDKNYTRIEMVKFVKEISEKTHAKEKYVFVNNGTGIIDYEGYLKAIDGMTSEETFYYNDEPATWSENNLKYLDKVIAEEKPVLTIDYSTKKELQCDFIAKAKEHEFVAFVTTKGLDTILKVDCN